MLIGIIVGKTVVVFTAIILSLFVLVYFNQRKLLYFPDKKSVLPETFTAKRMQVIKLTTSDQLRLIAWYAPAQSNQATFIYFHGNAGHLGYRMPLVNALIDRGLGVLLLSYRGYAGNPGKPSERGLYRDGRAALHYLIKRGVKNRCIVLFGESLGSGVATKIASEYPVGGVILQSPYTSISDVAKIHYPWIWLPPWDRYDSYSRIDQIKAPLLIIHGQEDAVVPFHLGKRLYDKANKPKRLLSLRGRGHNNLLSQEYLAGLFQFTRSLSPCEK